MLICAPNDFQMHVVVVGDRSSGASIFAFNSMIRAVFSSPDGAAEPLSDASARIVGVGHGEEVRPGLGLIPD